MDFAYFGEFVVTKRWVLWSLFAYFLLPFAVYLFVPFFIHRKSSFKPKTVSILVLGDIGHSPRMCYHALSFGQIGFAVNLCGYVETSPMSGIIEDINIDVFPIKAIQNKRKLPYLVFAGLKVFQQLFQLFSLLLDLRGSQYFMLQNPPSMPVLAVLVVFIKMFSPRSKLIIDWHNLNYSILNLKYNNLSHPVVRVMRLYEKYFSRYGWLHVTVTDKMKQFLETEFFVPSDSILALHDRPGPQFEPLSKTQRTQIIAQHEIFENVSDIENYKILVTATSFTPDEDFEVLLDALKKYDDVNIGPSMPLFVLVTGKGPMKKQFVSRVAELQFSKKVIIKTAWLSSEDYPVILGVADLSVSLHTSSSGIDLPMKILDFFGVGVPVITLFFPAIGELVKDGVNGLIAKSGNKAEISENLFKLLQRALGDEQLLSTLREGAIAESKKSWNENWMKVLGQVVDN